MKKFWSIIVLAFLILVPVQGALGLTVSVAPKSTIISGSIPSICFQTTSGKVCLPVRIPSTTSKIVIVKVNSQPSAISRTTPSITPAKTLPAPAPEPAVVNESPSTMQQEMLGYINAERAKANSPALVLDMKLSDGANLKSKDMALNGYFDHTSPTYGTPIDMMKSLGISYRMAGENIAKHTSVKGAHEAFMNSPGHRANILNTSFKKIGLGFYSYGHYLYVTQWFTN